MSTPRELGAQLRSRRRERGESQEATAAALGVTRQWLARVEAGTGNPDLRQMFALCDHLGLHLTALPSAHTTTSAELGCDARPAPAPRARRSVKASSAGKAGKAGKAVVPARLRVATAAPHVDLDQLLGRYRTGARSRSPANGRGPGRAGKPGRG